MSDVLAGGARALPRAVVPGVPATGAACVAARHALHRHRLGQARRQRQSVYPLSGNTLASASERGLMKFRMFSVGVRAGGERGGGAGAEPRVMQSVARAPRPQRHRGHGLRRLPRGWQRCLPGNTLAFCLI